MRDRSPTNLGARSATIYGLTVATLAVVVMLTAAFLGYDDAACAEAYFKVCGTPERQLLTFAPTAILMLGGIGAFIRTYQLWKQEQYSRAWHGVGWALFMLMLVYVVASAPVLLDR